MPRKAYEKQMRQLNEELTNMGMLIEKAIAGAVSAVKNRDMELAASVIEEDEEVDHLERDIETMCIQLLLKQQPVAGDLRQISSALKIVTDMERIGDQAAQICEIAIDSDYLKTAALPEYINTMAQTAIKMVDSSVDAYVKGDINLAHNVGKMDDTLDNLFRQIKNELVETIRSGIKNSENAIDIIIIAKYIEKIGDHAANIAEWVIYSISGRRENIN